MYKEGQVVINYDDVLRRAEQACVRSGRDFSKIQILTVTKYALPRDIGTLLKARNINCVAESRLQDSLQKWALPELVNFKVSKFFIGHLQTNKVAKVIENFDVICSLDSLRLAQAIDAKAQQREKQVKCLLQIKLTDKDTQGGVTMQQAPALIKEVRTQHPFINLAGIMAIAPITPDKEELRPLFKQVKNLFDGEFNPGDYLSLGMSEDFETAVEEGSTLPRIGSAIFKQI